MNSEKCLLTQIEIIEGLPDGWKTKPEMVKEEFVFPEIAVRQLGCGACGATCIATFDKTGLESLQPALGPDVRDCPFL